MELEQHLHMYRQMAKIRAFEEQVHELYKSAKMPGLAHLYVGEEAVAVGVCEALRRDDFITSTHRGHGHCLAKGASVDRMFAELLGKEPGYCRGKGGSMHIADPETGNLGANAIVGGSAGIATGAALSAKMRGSGQVAVCFFGDGALGQGLLYEVDEHGRALEAARHLRLREQPVRRVHAVRRDGRRRDPGARPAPSASTPRASTVRTCRRSTAAMRRLVERGAPRRGAGASSSARPTGTTATTSATSTGSTGSREEEREWMTEARPAPDLGRRGSSAQGLAERASSSGSNAT